MVANAGDNSLDLYLGNGDGTAQLPVIIQLLGQSPVAVVAVAGRCTLSSDELGAAGIAAVYAVADIEPDQDLRMSNAGALVERLAERIAADWLGLSRTLG